MSHVLTSACLAQQHVELLPPRTVLSMFVIKADRGGGNGGSIADPVLMMLGISQGGHGTPGADGADGQPRHGDS